jgi:hypothetical protein
MPQIESENYWNQFELKNCFFFATKIKSWLPDTAAAIGLAGVSERENNEVHWKEVNFSEKLSVLKLQNRMLYESWSILAATLNEEALFFASFDNAREPCCYCWM